MDLPNFCPDVFLEISGIDLREEFVERKLKDA